MLACCICCCSKTPSSAWHGKTYTARWSRRILDEVTRNLIDDRRATTEQAARLVGAMARAFADADFPIVEVAASELQMTNEPTDRHVLAAAVASDADAIVTFNLCHFPAAAYEPSGIVIVHPDAFLCDIEAPSESAVRRTTM